MLVEEWEACQREKEMVKVYGDGVKRDKDPRKEKQLDFRRGGREGNFKKDPSDLRRCFQKKVRMKFNHKPFREEYNQLRPIDYKTYGWLYW